MKIYLFHSQISYNVHRFNTKIKNFLHYKITIVIQKYFTKCNIYLLFQNISYVHIIQPFFLSFIIKKHIKKKLKQVIRMNLTLSIKSKEEEIQVIIHHWIRILNIKLGWIKEFNKFVVNYVSPFVLFFLNVN
ncbi:hypothetical protein RFI_01306 [Reticulomyxa filosa]|uniref:Uncharacterized protein n=1 Tax=Reticulomyxa filosa TaxID=46433 RepID=X6PC52_RETFI|nr:hypothetical protein RFI_01306 [Reticulomyxa filosa]|eukprot:ETO35756.1 hypothetical protein RFI_01306 [Reticulomyxa filosa]